MKKTLLTTCIAITLSVLPLKAQLVAHYTFTNLSGADVSGNNLNGQQVSVLNGGVFTTTTDHYGIADEAALMGDAGSISAGYYDVPSYSQLDFTNQLSVALWIKPGAITNTRKIVDKLDGQNTGNFMLDFYSGYLRFWVASGHVDFALDNSWLNLWMHVVGTYDGANAKLYINNTLVASAPVTGNLTTNTSHMIIGAGQGGSNSFYGAMDDLRIYSNPLSAADVTSLYNEAPTQCTVTIPNASFKANLVGNAAINTNGDNEIQCAEAADYTGAIDCSNLNITDLTGIEAFTALTALDCSYNQLTALDVSNNTALTYLVCSSNQITDLDVSNNISLTILRCFVNQLTSLDVSQNTTLIALECGNNQLTDLDLSNNPGLTLFNCNVGQLTSIDLSQNTALTTVILDNNQLTSLDVTNNTALTGLDCRFNHLTSVNVANGNNTNFSGLRLNGNPNLTCIQVDDAPYSAANWTGTFFTFDAGAGFSENCGLGVEEISVNNVLSVYPNPVTSIVQIEAEEITSIKIVNILGLTVAIQKLNAGKNTVDVSNLLTGVYFICPESGEAVKFVKD